MCGELSWYKTLLWALITLLAIPTVACHEKITHMLKGCPTVGSCGSSNLPWHFLLYTSWWVTAWDLP